MKITGGIAKKTGRNSDSALIHCNFELDATGPADDTVKKAFADAAASVDEQLRIQNAPAPREAGSDDQPWDGGDPSFDRSQPDRGRDDREPDTEQRRSNREERAAAYREQYDDRRDDDRDRGRSNDRRGDRRNGGGDNNREPKTGRQLFAWAKRRDEQSGEEGNKTLAWFSRFGKARNYPYQFNDWTEDDVADAMHEWHAKRGPTSAAAYNGQSSNGRRN
jgi:hypothetical protein